MLYITYILSPRFMFLKHVLNLRFRFLEHRYCICQTVYIGLIFKYANDTLFDDS